jgi:hypothetical protein
VVLGVGGGAATERFTASRISPLMVRKMAAASGLANRVRKVCSKASPVMPTGMVAMMSSQARRSSASVVTRRRAAMEGRMVRANPAMMRTQSERKKMIRATAVATCSATMTARYGLVSLVEVADWVTRASQLPPMKAGTSTECPRLDTGNSSVTPWRRPITTACR